MDALLSAYRVGARVAWRELSGTAVDGGLPPLTIARFAELVFAFIDELSAASVSGHADELASSDRERRRGLDRLGQQLLAGAPIDTLLSSAETVDWPPPDTLTAVLVPSAQMRGVLSRFGHSTLQLSEDLPGIDPAESVVLLLDLRHARSQPFPAATRIAGPSGGGRVRLAPGRRRRPPIPRILQAREVLPPGEGTDVLDTEAHLVELVLGANREVAADSAGTYSRRCRTSAPTPPNGWPKRCGRGCCIRANAMPWPPICSSTPRPSDTG